MPRSFAMKNFGCRAAQADGAGIAADLAVRGLLPASEQGTADLVVINACTVTNEADRDARQAIRRARRENPAADILVTGCYAQRKPADLAALDGVKWVVGNSHKHEIGEVVAPPLVNIGGAGTASLSYHGGIESGGTLVGEIGRRAGVAAVPAGVAYGRSRPNVKVQDGCDNRCSFCVIPSVRGRGRSAEADAVIREVRRLQGDYSEVVLTGINLGRWGRDLDGRPRLADLLETLLAETSVRRVRLSSVEPMDWSDRLIQLMASSPRIARHVHMPLQSGCDAILRRMRRRYRVRHYESRLLAARAAMPAAAIGADVMVGFPGEGRADFQETAAFVERMPFTYLHVFAYSSREGTEAAGLGGQVPKAVKRERSRLLRDLADRKNAAFRRSLVGTSVSSVALASAGGGARALSDNFVEIDVPGCPARPGALVDVTIDRVAGSRTVGHCPPSGGSSRVQ